MCHAITEERNEARYTAIKLVRQWQREHRQIAWQIEDLLYSVNVHRQPTRFQKHLFQLVVVREIMELHCETEGKLLEILFALRDGISVELEACARQVKKDHEIIMNRLNQVVREWEGEHQELIQGSLHDEREYLFDLFSEYWEQHEERVELAIRVFFPTYPESRTNRFEKVELV